MHLDAAAYHQKLSEPDTVVIDVRNKYESDIGRFGAQEQVRRSTNLPVSRDIVHFIYHSSAFLLSTVAMYYYVHKKGLLNEIHYISTYRHFQVPNYAACLSYFLQLSFYLWKPTCDYDNNSVLHSIFGNGPVTTITTLCYILSFETDL